MIESRPPSDFEFCSIGSIKLVGFELLECLVNRPALARQKS